MDWALIIQTVQETAGILGEGHILDYIGIGGPGALAVHFYWWQREQKAEKKRRSERLDEYTDRLAEKDAEIEKLCGECQKYQDKWIEAMTPVATD